MKTHYTQKKQKELVIIFLKANQNYFMDINILNISVFTCPTFIELNFYLKKINSKIYLQ